MRLRPACHLVGTTRRHFESRSANWANGVRYLRVGGRGQNFESRILLGRGKCSKMPQNPTRQVHALLGGGYIWVCGSNFNSPCTMLACISSQTRMRRQLLGRDRSIGPQLSFGLTIGK
ncbi:MAG: hypothetical protein ILNGONEN_00332 [Syntrophorhabdaceae bacterium]|nr:hypothetical protein [Syntrophorhabdaceae bacterium]